MEKSTLNCMTFLPKHFGLTGEERTDNILLAFTTSLVFR